MEIALYIFFGILGILTAVHIFRLFKLRQLQKKRNNCDLSTEKGRYAARQYNKRINKLMNFSDTDTAGGHN
jgi:hypothetical protein